MPNRLVHETSPYLRQHAENPVDWYPWGDEALARARREDKPVFLSIGYAACHWCHVMERESFENAEIARVLNEHFISIKVDREERPDLDSVYMMAVQAMTGQGGWPLSVFLTPQGLPFYGGTYFPPEERGGLPAFPRLLQAVAAAYRERKGEVARVTGQVLDHLETVKRARPPREPLTAEILRAAAERIAHDFDPEHGGFGNAPKFPQPMTLEFLLRYWRRSGDAHALEMVEKTLTRMAHGGVYDQLGGGFHRYSTDPFWLVPHFEKMLYDQALLARVYLHAFQATGSPLYRRVAGETLDYVLRDMTSPEGGFYSTRDADSEGEEGRYYVWMPQEIASVLGDQDAERFFRIYGVTPGGNFEGRNILHLAGAPEELAPALGMSRGEMESFISSAKARLLAERERRIPPARDEKVLAGWNGMMLRTLAEAGAALGRQDFLGAARRDAAFVLDKLRLDGRLMRSYKDGRARVKGFLEDYAEMADGLLALYEATFERRWLDEARALAEAMLELFWSEDEGAFYDTGNDQEALVTRPRDVFDNATPSGSAVATDVLLRLGLLTGEPELSAKAPRALRSVREYMVGAPSGFGHWLGALDFYLSEPKEIAIIGSADEPGAEALHRVVFARYLPNKVVAGGQGNGAADGIPLLESRARVNGRPAAYVCKGNVCQLPATTPEDLARQLQ